MTRTRRQLLISGAGGAIAVAIGGFELIEHGVLPAKQSLNELDGACSVSEPALSFGPAGPSQSGSFVSAARGRAVGFTIAYPPGHGPGSALALLISLHGFGGDHRSGLGGLSLPRALAVRAGDGGCRRWRSSPSTAAAGTGTPTPATTRWR